jgi:hypothetical protein
MAKIHFNVNGHNACGRTGRMLESVNRVTCLNCQKRPEFIEAQVKATAAETEAFLAQEPREFREPWKEGTITCGECLGTLFREANRTCYGHYANYVCAGCGSNQSRLTETGMSF